MGDKLAQSSAEREFFNSGRTAHENKEAVFLGEVLKTAEEEAAASGCALEGYPYTIPSHEEIVRSGVSWSAPQLFRVMENGEYTGVCYDSISNKWTFPRKNMEFDSLEDALNEGILEQVA
ncbi:MAG: hypothetical protein US42_C0010G0011 [Candidatus Magasanikbacteria bacterium GW2011_GWC2_37_14]|uniref:Uncharacterized protein n=1 Tax=Candidatus Magasanikbacteria bacterium GW2011_GWC2_37_14 TaxID=1619046 RepID=A0A0G0IT76_9BACT|nr:MAG: hypothetical protein US42_C0010G0011 [Candidatus Magasanikbacteria bacterium GW2011_GWC2_37_14]